MQYLLHDLLKLPLSERLIIIEQAISSITETSLRDKLSQSLSIAGDSIQPETFSARQ